MGGDFFSNFWKGGDLVNEFGKPWPRSIVALESFEVKSKKKVLGKIYEEFETYTRYCWVLKWRETKKS